MPSGKKVSKTLAKMKPDSLNLQAKDVESISARDIDGLAAAMPENANKALEYGLKNAHSPHAGSFQKPASDDLLASTRAK